MLTASKLKIIQEIIAGSTQEELIWLNGYLAGILAAQGELEQETNTHLRNQAVGKITSIAYGTAKRKF